MKKIAEIIVSPVGKGIKYVTTSATGQKVEGFAGSIERLDTVIVSELHKGASTVTVAKEVHVSEKAKAYAVARKKIEDLYEKELLPTMQELHDAYVDSSISGARAASLLGFSTSVGYKNNTVEKFKKFLGESPANLENSMVEEGRWELDENGYLITSFVESQRLSNAVADGWVNLGGILAPTQQPEETEEEENLEEQTPEATEEVAEQEPEMYPDYGYDAK